MCQCNLNLCIFNDNQMLCEILNQHMLEVLLQAPGRDSSLHRLLVGLTPLCAASVRRALPALLGLEAGRSSESNQLPVNGVTVKMLSKTTVAA